MLAFLACALDAAYARAANYCDASHPMVHVSGKLVWCADPTFWAAHAQDVTPFFAYADALLPTLSQDFGVDAPGPFYIVVNQPNGGASTPTPYGPGINITGDAFYNTAYGIRGFYGYVLVTHEFVNQWTGLMGGSGWPTDWWANHRSPFPNAMDPLIMAQLKQPQAASAQAARFLPGGDSADAQVPMFTALLRDYGGFGLVRRLTDLLHGDAMQWGGLADPPDYTRSTQFISGNPSALRSHYVAAYLSLAARADVTPRLNAAGVGKAPPNWPANGPAFKPYALDPARVANIANAHCGLNAARAQGTDISAALKALQRGNSAAVAPAVTGASCGAGCPQECGCSSTGACVVPWQTSTSAGPAPATDTDTLTVGPSPRYSADVPQGNTAPGTQLQLWPVNNQTSQRFSFAGGQLTVLGRCVAAAANHAKAAVVLQACSGAAPQQWVKQGDTLQLRGTNLCLDVPNGVVAPRTKLWLYTCNGSTAQSWHVPG
jgi:hypothetical protein